MGLCCCQTPAVHFISCVPITSSGTVPSYFGIGLNFGFQSGQPQLRGYFTQGVTRCLRRMLTRHWSEMGLTGILGEVGSYYAYPWTPCCLGHILHQVEKYSEEQTAGGVNLKVWMKQFHEIGWVMLGLCWDVSILSNPKSRSFTTVFLRKIIQFVAEMAKFAKMV